MLPEKFSLIGNSAGLMLNLVGLILSLFWPYLVYFLGDPTQEDMDLILILSRDAYYIARYDDDVDKVTQYQRVALADIEKIEFGVLDQPNFQVDGLPTKLLQLFPSF